MDQEQKQKLRYMAAKALGFINAIANYTREERQHSPSAKFGRDYNQLRSVVYENCPDLVELLPPEVTIERYDTGGEYCKEYYTEVYAFCEQIYQMVTSLYETN